MKVKKQGAELSPRSSKNMRQGSQYNYAGLVHIHAVWLCLHCTSPCCFSFLLTVGEAMEIQLCLLSAVIAIGKQPGEVLEQRK